MFDGRILGMDENTEQNPEVKIISEAKTVPFEYKEIDEVLKNTEGGQINFRNDSYILMFLRIGIFLIVIQIIILLMNYKSLPSEVPLFYSLPWGEKRLTNVNFLFVLPSLSLLVLLINSLISKKIYDKERLLSRISLFIALAFVVLTIITLSQIVFVIS